jgi:PAS domain S-box-containing protein
MKVKHKIRTGLLFLLTIIILLAFSGSYYINKLADESKDIVKENYHTLLYTQKMIQALDETDEAASLQLFEANLEKQEKNITEAGEDRSTAAVRAAFETYRRAGSKVAISKVLREKILHIQELNMKAIVAKNEAITHKTKTAFAYITILGTMCFLFSFTFVVNFPRWIAEPITLISEGIKEITTRNYKARIIIKSNDEFGDVAAAFNQMASQLDTWEHSNLAQLMFEKSRIDTLINNMHDPVIGLDENKKVIFINNEALKITGLKATDTIGKSSNDIALRNDLMRSLIQQNNTISNAEPLKIYADNKESYFQKEVVNISITTENGSSRSIGDVIVLKNITPFKELDAAKTNFIATVSHELKTPLASILMSLQLLENEKTGTINEQQKQLMDGIKDDSNRLLKITGELLKLSQVETGNIQLSMQQGSPAEILQYALDAVKNTAEQSGIRIAVEAANDLPLIKADTEKTAWVLINLLSNAIRYSEQNTTIQVAVQQQHNQIHFSVKDQGKGIAPVYQHKIFDRYFQVPGSSKSGTGLGLAISKEFIEAQGGQILLQSCPGQGSTFTVVLNVA